MAWAHGPLNFRKQLIIARGNREPFEKLIRVLTHQHASSVLISKAAQFVPLNFIRPHEGPTIDPLGFKWRDSAPYREAVHAWKGEHGLTILVEFADGNGQASRFLNREP
jgi:hypothetical protein